MSLNSRKAAKSVPATLSRLVKTRLIKSPPPSFYAVLSHPPPPSLVRSVAARDESDLPPWAVPEKSLWQVAKKKYDEGAKLTPEEKATLESPGSSAFASGSSKKRRNHSNTRKVKIHPIVFPEDAIRQRFFKDHPFEAYRPTTLVERELLQEEEEPKGKAWTELGQRAIVPTAEDCITFIRHLTEVHGIPPSEAYLSGIAQFRTLRSEHEIATRAAVSEAESFGAVFFSEVDRGVKMEDKVLDKWRDAQAIQANLLAKATRVPMTPASAFDRTTQQPVRENTVREEVPTYEFTGGDAYLERFRSRAVNSSPL